MTDATEAGRRLMAQAINSQPAHRQQLEEQVGQCWNTEEAFADFEFIGFAAPFAFVTRKADGVKGSLMFQNLPRYYFKFKPAK